MNPQKSASLAACEKAGHKTVQHSPNGLDKILECPQCCRAWLIAGITGDETRLWDSIYERRLREQIRPQ